jgi:hypothetical protein
MKRTDKSDVWGAVLKGAGVLAAGGVLYYLIDGAGSQKTSALIPKSIEDRLDHVVDALNQSFDQRWVDVSLQFLQEALASVLPPALVTLIGFIVQAEKFGLQNGWNGPQKKRHALSLATQ